MTIPDAILAHHTAALGKTGSGKTSTSKLLVERASNQGAEINTGAVEAARQAAYHDGHRYGLDEGLAAARSLLARVLPKAKDLYDTLDAIEIDAPAAAPVPAQPKAETADSDLPGPQRQLLAALDWWAINGHDAATRAQVAAVAGWKVTSGHLKNVAGALRTKGLIDYPTGGTMALTDAGRAAVPLADQIHESCPDRIRKILSGPQRQAFDVLLDNVVAMPRGLLAQRCGWNPTSGHVKNVLGSLRTLRVIDYPGPGLVKIADWVN